LNLAIMDVGHRGSVTKDIQESLLKVLAAGQEAHDIRGFCEVGGTDHSRSFLGRI